MIEEKIEGNLLDMFDEGRFDVIVHGCNCFNTMKSGIAKQIVDRYPKVAEVDSKTKKGDPFKLGSLQSVEVGENKYIVNMYTQYTYGSGKQVEYRALINAFMLLDLSALGENNYRIGIPLIGAGLAGGKWDVIEDIINQVTPKTPITLVQYNP